MPQRPLRGSKVDQRVDRKDQRSPFGGGAYAGSDGLLLAPASPPAAPTPEFGTLSNAAAFTRRLQQRRIQFP